METGALNLASPEVKMYLGLAEFLDPIHVEQKVLREMNSLMEVFMLLANASVAKKNDEVFPQTAVQRGYRVPTSVFIFRLDAIYPPKMNFKNLQDVRKGFGLES